MLTKDSHNKEQRGESSDLKEALHILQDVNPTVAEVVLLRHTWTGALHHLLTKASLGAFAHLPLHLQVSKENVTSFFMRE